MTQDRNPQRLASGLPVAQASVLALRARCDAVSTCLKKLRRARRIDPEAVHKLRVATRRLSALLEVLKACFPKRARTRMARLARKLRRKCGRLRDLDVHIPVLASCKGQASEGDAAVIQLAIERFQKQRRRAQKRLQNRIDGLASKFELLSAKLLRKTQRGGRDQGPCSQDLTEMALRQIGSAASSLWSNHDRFETPQDLHRLRIAIKHLRYVMEVFLPVIDESFRDDFLPQLVHLQDLLGEVQNSAAGMDMLVRMRRGLSKEINTSQDRKAGKRRLGKQALRSGLNVVRSAYVANRDQALRAFFELWPGFSGNSFRHPLEALIEGRAAMPANAGFLSPRQGNGQENTNSSVTGPQPGTATGAPG